MAMFGVGVVMAPIIGPTLGGWLTDSYSWRWIFLINIPVGVISLILTYFLIFDPPFLTRKRLKDGVHIDFIGLGLLSVGLGFLQVVLDKGQREDWFESHFIVACAVLSVIGLVAAADLGTHSQRSHRGSSPAERPEFLSGHADDVYAGICPLRQHRVCFPFFFRPCWDTRRC